MKRQTLIAAALLAITPPAAFAQADLAGAVASAQTAVDGAVDSAMGAIDGVTGGLASALSSFMGSGGKRATEKTQRRNFAQLIYQLMQQKDMLKTMLKNLESNPHGLSQEELMRVTKNISDLIQDGKDLGSSLEQVNQNYAQLFNDDMAAGYAEKYRQWTEISTASLQQASQLAGMQRGQFADDERSLQQLVRNISGTQGNLAALQALGNINAVQIQEAMKLRDLIATQQQATNNVRTAQVKKEQAIADMNARLWQFENKPLPPPRPQRPGQF